MKDNRYVSLIKRVEHRLAELINLENETGDHFSGIEYQADLPYLIKDPRINFIKQLIKMLYSYFPRSADIPAAFRLKKLKDWLMLTDTDDIINQMSWDCHANCIFCYQKGLPPSMKLRKRLSKEEIDTRLKYFDFKQKLGLTAGENLNTDELLTNPHISEIIKELRKKDLDQLIVIPTNGKALVPKLVRALSHSKPLLLTVSLNSANPKCRRHLMKDYNPEVAINSLALLKKYKIPFVVSIVVWPGLPLSDIKNTIRYAQKNDAYLIRLILPGYTKFFPIKTPFNAKCFWKKTIKSLYPLFNDFSTPILFYPYMYVQKTIHERIDLPIVIGTIKNSPAYDLKIKAGSMIETINRQAVDSVEEALAHLTQNLNGKVNLKIKYKDKTHRFTIKDKPANRYPYSFKASKLYAPFGFILSDKCFLCVDDVLSISRYIKLHDAKNVLILASLRAKPFLKRILKKYNVTEKCGAKIRIITPKNYFFGGTIDTGDLLTVYDCIRSIQNDRKKYRPDLIILPFSPFSKWGRDLTGRINLDIERQVGIPVEFIYNNNIEVLK